MRLFEMIREEDVSGVSGTGPVAQAVEFDSGKVAVSFYLHTAGTANVIVYDSIEDAEKIHGHGGLTHLRPVVHPHAFLGENGWRPAEARG